jgi:protein-disulfide isomerase
MRGMKKAAATVTVLVFLLLQASGHAQEPTIATLQQQIEKLNASQDALRRQVLGMQQQLTEMMKLLQPRPGQPAAAAVPAEPPLPAEIATAGAPSKGTPTAPITIVEFSDFQCPFCGRHFRDTYGQIDREYIASGKVRYVFRHLPLERIHPQAFKAGEAAECAGAQNRFWEMHDVLFANQQALMPPDLARHAQGLKLDLARFNACLEGQTAARIRQDMTLAVEAGVRATPTFIVGTTLPGGRVKVVRRLSGALPFATFKGAIDSLLAGVSSPQ